MPANKAGFKAPDFVVALGNALNGGLRQYGFDSYFDLDKSCFRHVNWHKIQVRVIDK
jgi:hypothetical protein